ncbi:MAG TPA: thioredoxin family protein [Bacillota bacterium]|nr:thioredoxin family protein [Bacillota bacterium]
MIYLYSAEKADRLDPWFSQGIVILWFTASWCGTCRAVKRALSGSNRETVPIIEIDVEGWKPLAERFHVRGVPMLLLLKDGEVLDRKGGSLDHAEFTAWYDSHPVLKPIGGPRD